MGPCPSREVEWACCLSHLLPGEEGQLEAGEGCVQALGRAGGVGRKIYLHLGGGVCGGHLQYLFCSGSSAAVGFWSLCIFWVQNLPQQGMRRITLTVTSFFVILFWREVCQVQALQHRKEGVPRVPAGLICFVGYSPMPTFFHFKRIFKFVVCPSIWKLL